MGVGEGGMLKRIDHWGAAIENFVLVLLLGSMMLLAVGQIVLRLFFSIGFVWVDELISLSVLWIAIVASVAAARSDRHLRIDALSHFVSEKYARLPRIVVDGFASGMCVFLAWQGFRYVQFLREGQDTVLVNVPQWLVMAVVPIAFVLMANRFLLLAVKGAMKALSESSQREDNS